MAEKTILAVNDDGIKSKGLEVLAEAAQSFGEVFVVAPLEEMSGVGKGITLGQVNVTRHPFHERIVAYAIDGTPADAVLLGLEYLLPREPDLVLSGVNLGPNLGVEDFFDSGTIGAAIEAAIHGKLGIAFSLAMSREQRRGTGYNLAGTKEVVERILKAILSNESILSLGEVISVNIPYPTVNGMRASNISKKALRSVHFKTSTGYSMKSWGVALYQPDDENSDVHVIRELKSVSISVVNLSLENQFAKAVRIVNAT